jgi:hypothetical protein
VECPDAEPVPGIDSILVACPEINSATQSIEAFAKNDEPRDDSQNTIASLQTFVNNSNFNLEARTIPAIRATTQGFGFFAWERPEIEA